MTETEKKLTAALFMACRTFVARCAGDIPLLDGTGVEKQRYIAAVAVPLMEGYLKDVEEIGAETVLTVLARARQDAERFEQSQNTKEETP